ncbi:MAG: hypothetical protein M1616_06150 [Candidatus Thermoplasmatota archaeon]|jgi:hypothetical protein|nr:hypothetical protein [Candidatus Thermoplasmatota archaeon]
MVEDYASDDSRRLFLNSFFFSSGWFTLSFAFPLILLGQGYGYEIIGVLGLASSAPFPVMAALYLYSGKRMIRYGILFPVVFLAIVSITLIFFYSREMLLFAILACILQAPWWIATEINLNSLESSGNAEKYSVGWGIPNAVIPILMGFILQFSSIYVLFLFAFGAFIAGMFFTPRVGAKKRIVRKDRVEVRYSIALLFAGLFSGFLYFILEPTMRTSGFSYGIIGTVIGIYGISSAASYISLNYVHDIGLRGYSVLSAILIAPVGFLGFFFQIYVIITVVVLGGLGVSLAMSKILSHLIGIYPPRKGVFFYETFFGVGFIIGSFGLDSAFQLVGRSILLIILFPTIAYAIIMSSSYGRETSVTRSS